MIRAGVVGASGFAGAELLRLLAGHPAIEAAVVTGETRAGQRVADLYPSLAAAYGDKVYERSDPVSFEGLDVVFCALPHGESQRFMADLVARVPHVIDLAADFRLLDPAEYKSWYGDDHLATQLLGAFAYGLPELHRSEIKDKGHAAVPGCYPTAAILALWPLVKAGLVDTTGIVVDAASGVSGAGRAPKDNTTFCTVDEDFCAYGVGGHRHTPEIEQELGASVLFTPHLAPMNRGILATCYARPAGTLTDTTLQEALRDAYSGEPFVVVSDSPPHTKATLGSNCAHVNAVYDARTGYAMAFAAIDNLTKGAAGGALQCANLVLGLEETAGLPNVGVMP